MKTKTGRPIDMNEAETQSRRILSDVTSLAYTSPERRMEIDGRLARIAASVNSLAAALAFFYHSDERGMQKPEIDHAT